MKTINVLHVVGTLNLGGAETMLMNILKESDKESIKFHFLCFGDPRDFYYTNIAKKYNANIYFIDYPIIYKPLKHIFDIRNFIERNNFDLVHIHTLLHSGIVSYALKKYRLPVIVHAHSSVDNNLDKNVFRLLYEKTSKLLISKYATNFISCSNEASNYLFSYVDNHSNNIIMFNNSIVLSKYTKKEFDIELENFNSNNINIFSLGRLEKIKNISYALELIKEISNNENNFHYYIIGDGSEKSKLETYVDDHNINEYVTFLGTREDVPKLLYFMDIHLMPSLFEGFPVTLLETQASSVRSIVSNKIDKSVDLGFNLIEFISLKDKEMWIKTITDSMIKKEYLNTEKLIDRFKTLKYDSKEAYIQLLEIYNKILDQCIQSQ